MEYGFSLGSNLGDRLAHLSEARRRMAAVPHTLVLAQSSVYETEPVGVEPAYRELQFLNAVLIVESPRPAEQWMETLARIEEELGRVRGPDHNAPRPIDIDLLYAGDACIDRGGLTVPHPRWAQRRFVVEPLAEVRPDLVLPGAGRPVCDILAALPAGEHVRRLPDAW